MGIPTANILKKQNINEQTIQNIKPVYFPLPIFWKIDNYSIF